MKIPEPVYNGLQVIGIPLSDISKDGISLEFLSVNNACEYTVTPTAPPAVILYEKPEPFNMFERFYIHLPLLMIQDNQKTDDLKKDLATSIGNDAHVEAEKVGSEKLVSVRLTAASAEAACNLTRGSYAKLLEKLKENSIRYRFAVSTHSSLQEISRLYQPAPIEDLVKLINR